MSCPCCAQSCGCVTGCSLTITYFGTTTVQAFGSFGLAFSPTARDSDEPGVFFATMAGYFGNGAVYGRFANARETNAAACLSSDLTNRLNDINNINAQMCDPTQNIVNGRYNGRHVDFAFVYGENIGVTECAMYSLAANDGTPCPLPQGVSKDRLTLELIGTVRLKTIRFQPAGNPVIAALDAAKCSGGCGEQVSAVSDALQVPSTGVPAMLRGYGDPLSPCAFYSGTLPWTRVNPTTGCTQVISAAAFGPPQTGGNYIGYNGVETPANGFRRRLVGLDGCNEVLSDPIDPATPWSCNGQQRRNFNFGGWEYMCQYWSSHPTPSVSLVCAP